MISEYRDTEPLRWFNTGTLTTHCGDGWIGVLPKHEIKAKLELCPSAWSDGLTLFQAMQWAEENNIPYAISTVYPFGKNIDIDKEAK